MADWEGHGLPRIDRFPLTVLISAGFGLDPLSLLALLVFGPCLP
jgi:hypothetical protein